MKRLNINLDDVTARRLAETADNEERTETNIVRRALTLYFEVAEISGRNEARLLIETPDGMQSLTFEWLPSRDAALALERELIAGLRPPFNIEHHPETI